MFLPKYQRHEFTNLSLQIHKSDLLNPLRSDIALLLQPTSQSQRRAVPERGATVERRESGATGVPGADQGSRVRGGRRESGGSGA